MALLLAGCLGGADNIDEPDSPSSVDLLLTADVVHSVRWTVYAVPGYEPHELVLNEIQSLLESVNGPGSAQYLGLEALHVEDVSESHHWSSDELLGLRARFYTEQSKTSDRWVVFVFLNGDAQYGTHDSAGLAMEQTAFVFRDAFDSFATVDGNGLLPNPGIAELERTVTMHELGHVLGLVGNGAPMTVPRLPPPNQDPCQCHSSQRDSVMYPMVNGWNGTLEFLLKDGHLPYKFNEADWQDLRSYQEALRQADQT